MFIVSSEIVSPGVEGLSLFLMVPFLSSIVTVSLAHFMRNLEQTRQFT
jgi:hypothetical protein